MQWDRQKLHSNHNDEPISRSDALLGSTATAGGGVRVLGTEDPGTTLRALWMSVCPPVEEDRDRGTGKKPREERGAK